MADPSIWTAIGEALKPTAVAVVTLGGAWLVQRLGERKSKKPHESVDVLHRREAMARDALNDLRNELDARRAFLARVHNGDQFIDGSDILKYSWVYEVCQYQVGYIGEHRKNILTSTMVEEWELVAEDGPGFRVVDEMPPSKAKFFFEQQGAGAVARYPIYAKPHSPPVGFVGVDFGPGVSAPPENIDAMLQAAFRIENVIAGNADTPPLAR